MKEFKNIQIGDIVIITQHGKNQGKMGIVRKIDEGSVYLEPFQCEFEFANKSGWRLHKYKDLYGFGYVSVNHPSRPEKSDKTFYIADKYGGEGIEWSTSNFTNNELNVIDRFLKELEEHSDIEEIVILDSETEDFWRDNI